MTIISVLYLAVMSINVISYSDPGVVFLFLWVYGNSLFGLCILLQSYFSSAKIAAITGTLVYFGTSFNKQVVTDPNVEQSAKNLASLLFTVAVSLGTVNFALFEGNG